MLWCESFNGTSEHQVSYGACLQAQWESKHNPSSHKLFFYHKWPDWWSFHMLSKKFVLLRKQTCFSLNSLLVISPKTFQASFFLLLLKWSVKSVNQSGIYSDTNLEFNVWLHHVHCLLCIVSEECASLMRLIDWTNMALMEFYKAIAIDA